MSKYYSLCLDVQGKKSVVVGGGNIAERKTKTLLQAGAQVWVVSSVLNNKLEELKERNYITHIKDTFKNNYLDGAFLVIGATDNHDVNACISREAKKKNILVNIVDCPERCNFIVPAVVERGDLSISISTAGKSPALAKKIKKELEEKYCTEYATFLDIMGEVRNTLSSTHSSAKCKQEIFTRVVANLDEIIDRIKKWGHDNALERVKEIIDDQ